jgi:uncharacterized protein
MRKTYILFGVLLSFMLITTGCDNKKSNTQESKTGHSNIIIDNAHVMTGNNLLIKMYRDYNDRMLKDFDIDFRVVTTRNKENINIFANKAFKKLQQESRSKSGKALLLVVNTLQDKVRMEVSMALEPIYTDAYISYVERKGMVPYLRDLKIADGIYMMTELARDRAYEASIGKEFMPPMQSKSIGAGAKSKAHIGVVDKEAKKGAMIQAQSGETPKNVLKRYITNVLKKHNKNPNLDIYTNATKTFFTKWTVTDINQNHEVHNLAPCIQKYETLYDTDMSHAVLAVRPYDTNRKCSPYFFKKEQGKWKMDIATMAQILHFNQNMQFHFDMKNRLRGEAMYYSFAFDGYGFDNNGFPFTPKRVKKEKFRWGFQCGAWVRPDEVSLYKQNPDKYNRCWINYRWYGSPAEVRLGLQPGDYVIAVGDGMRKKKNVNFKNFMRYMANVPAGELATVTVVHNGKTVKRQGIAP